MNFKLWLEGVQMKMHLHHLNHHHGQDDFAIYATDEKNVVYGKLEFSVYQGEPNINWIQVSDDRLRQGIARQMIQRLVQEGYPYHTIHWGMMTDDGSVLKQKLDGEFQASGGT